MLYYQITPSIHLSLGFLIKIVASTYKTMLDPIK